MGERIRQDIMTDEKNRTRLNAATSSRRREPLPALLRGISRDYFRPVGDQFVEARAGGLRRPRQRRGRAGADRRSQQRLDAVADVDETIVDQATNRLKGSASSAAGQDRSRVCRARCLRESDQRVDVVMLATPPGFRPQHLTAAINANKHVFCEKPCATDSPGVRDVMAAQKLAQTKNLSSWRGSAGATTT